MIYSFDIDNTLLNTIGNDYSNSKPIQRRIDDVNQLYDEGHTVILFTARGSASKKDYSQLTIKQIKSFGIKHHELIFHKPNADIFIDDKAFNSQHWATLVPNNRVVWTNGCFDVLHIGHIRMINECVRQALIYDAKLVVGIDSDRRVSEIKGKQRPLNNQQIRSEFLLSIKGVESVVIFDNEKELNSIISQLQPEIMVVGDDYIGRTVIGSSYTKKLIFFPKIVGYSSTKIIKGAL